MDYALTSLFALEGEDDDGESVNPLPKAQTATRPLATAGTLQQDPGNKNCDVCGKAFTPDPKWPKSTTCSGICGNKKKAGAAPVAKPVAQEYDGYQPAQNASIHSDEIKLEDIGL